MYQIDFNSPIHVHFIGIGGISMSGLAEILLDRGFTVSGSDMKESRLTDSLIKKGARVAFSQVAENITDDIDLVVYTAAVHKDNPELAAVLSKGIPNLTRAELLGQIMKNYELPVAIAGTHGKTTTTSMVSEILMEAETDPTLTIGGILPSIGGNIRVGNSKYFVAEACEYTNSFLSFFPKISMILNIDADHLDFFKDLADIRNSFHRFALLLPEDGTLIINADIPDLADFTKDLTCRVISYSNHTEADYTAKDVTYDAFAHPTFTAVANGKERTLSLGVPGEHNVSNALAALAFADLCDIPFEAVSAALAKFNGTDRRFQKKGEVDGVTIIDDYAHHPTEIAATLKAAKNYPHKKLWLAFQPHTYTRTKALLPEFADALSHADHVILADIYAAREKNTIGISSQDLQKEIAKRGVPCEYFPTFEEIENFLQKNYAPGDVVITMGAGNIVDVGEDLLKK
ncbi:MAG: UDP-N-acetylmuramate--L-alanine ligase [Lachnospiraceae bacterium]|nr:UDP-N-acetylmuramate--L-alanine ligase [Lachnospiraceae bacterium]